MMDFNLILLLVGLGLLLLVSVFVLLGCFAGLKKELKCTAIAFVLLLLTLLVFGNSSTLLNANGTLLKNFIQGIPSSAETIWDCVLALVQSNVDGGAEIFAEGTKSYAFLYSVVGGLARGVMLLVGTFAMFIIIVITVGIYRLVTRIIAHNKAKKRAEAGEEEPAAETDKVIADNVLVAQSESGETEGTMITAGKQPVKKGSSKHRVWAGCLAGLRAVIAIIFLFAPVSGVCSVLDSISPETEKLINESLSGGKQETAATENGTILDTVLDFKDAYYDSALGKFIEGSSFFFGDSFSTQLFDSAFKIEGSNNDINIRDEAITVIEAVNALEGNTKLNELTQSQVAGALEALKDSELIVEAIPVAIEVAYYYPLNEKHNIKFMGTNESLKDFLFVSNQQAAFLQLRQLDWNKNVEAIFDAIEEAYKLGFLSEDFNVLTMDPEVLSASLAELSKADGISSILNIAIQVALKHEEVIKLVGEIPAADLTNFDWAAEYQTIVEIYKEFQKLEITSLNDLNLGELVNEIVNNEEKLQVVVNTVELVTELQLLKEVAYEAALGYVTLNAKYVKDFGTDIKQSIKDLAKLDLSEDINIYVDAVVAALPLVEFGEGLQINVDYLNLDAEVLHTVIDTLFATESFEKVIPIGVYFALTLEPVKKIIGEGVEINTANIDWHKDFTKLVDVYAEFQELEIKTLENVNVKQLLADILNDEQKVEVLSQIVKLVTELQVVSEVGVDLAVNYVSNIKLIKDAGTDVVEAVKNLANVDLANDVNVYVEALKLALPLVEITDGLGIKVDYLAMDPATLQTVVDKLFESESFEKILPIGTNIALSLPAVEKLLNGQELVINTADINWKQDFTTLVNIYKSFQDLGVESIDELKQPLDLAKAVLADDEKVAALKVVLGLLPELTLYPNVIIPAGDIILTDLIAEKAPNFDGILDITALSEEAWKSDFESLVLLAEHVYEVCGLNFNLSAIDFYEVGGYHGKEIVDLLFNLNLLGSDATKNELVKAALKQFKVMDDEAIANLDLSEVVWVSSEGYSEVAMLKELLTTLGKASKLEGVNLNEMKFDYNEMLNCDDTYDLAFDVLDSVVDSKLILQLVPSLIDKYLVPQLEKLEDEEGTLNSIITNLDSAELIAEIQKLIDVAKACVELNVLNIKTDGIQAVDFANTEAIKTIINGIFDSKILEGYESRVVRIILKLTQLFPNLEKGTFDHVDFDREQSLLIDAIDELEIVLKDENFLTFENGKIKLDMEYYTKEETLDALLGALKVLFGEYKVDSTVDGSQIIEVLLPELFEKFVSNLIPTQYAELMEILNIENSHPRLLADDVRKVLYIAETLVEVKVQSYLLEKDYNFASAAEAIQTTITTLFDLNMVNGSENEIVAWALNYVQTAAKLNLGVEFTANDFATVDWDVEVELINELIADVIKFTNNNKISSVNAIIDFIKSKGFLSDEFLETHNFNVLFEIIEDLFNLQTVEQILPVGLEYALNLAKNKNIDVTFLGENMTGELLVEDIKSIVKVLEIAVYDVQIVEYKKANWNGELPSVDYVVEILDILISLNLLDGKENQLLRFVVDKVIPNNPYISADDFAFGSQYDFDADWAKIKEALPLIYDLIYANNITKIEEVKAFIKDKWYASVDLVKDYNLLIAADLLEVLADTQLVQQALIAVVNNAVKLEALTKIGDFSSLTNLTKPELASDVKALASVVRQAVAANLLQYYETQDLEPINYEAIAGILETVGTLNVLNKCGEEILPEVVNYVLGKNSKLNLNYEFTSADFAVVNWVEETELLGEVLVKSGDLLESLNLDSLSDILLFINNKDFTNHVVLTTENVNKVIEIVDLAVNSKIIQAVSVPGLDFALNLAKNKGFDVTFLSGKLSAEQLVSDLGVIVEIVQNAVDFGAIEYVTTGNIENINVDYVVEIIALLEELNILTCAQTEWTAFAAEKLVNILKLDVTVLADNYNYVDYAAENALLQQAVALLGDLLGNENLQSVEDIKAFIKNKDYLDINAFNDKAVANVQELLLLVADSEILSVHLVDLFEYAVSFAGKKLAYDCSFVNDIFTAAELQEDIRTLVEISDHLYEFGIVDLIFTGDVVINLDPVIEVVKLLENVNILHKTNDYIAQFVYNLILPKLGLATLEVDDFKEIDFASENALLVSILEEAKVLLEVEDLDTVSAVLSFVKNKKFLYIDKYEQTFSDAAIDSASKIVSLAVSSELVQLELVPLFNYAITKVSAKFDVSFLKNSVTTDELVNDVNVLINMAKLAVEFGALEYVFTKNIEVIELDPVVEIVALLESLNIAKNNNKEFTALVFNLVYKKLGLNKARSSIDASEFENIDYALENAKLQEIIDLIGWIQADFMLTSLEDVIKFVTEKQYANYKEFQVGVYTHAQELINAVVDSQLVQYALPTGFDYGLNLVAKKGFDLTYLSGEFTGEQLANDVKVLVNEAVHWVRDLNVLDVIETKEIQANYVDELSNTVRALKDVNILNVEQERLVTMLTNMVFTNVLKYQGTIDASYFEGVDWSVEFDAVADVLVELGDIVETFGVAHGLLSLEGLKQFANVAKDLTNFDAEFLCEAADVLVAISKSKALTSEAVFAQEYLISFLAAKDMNLMAIYSSREELSEDLGVLANFVVAAAEANVHGFAFANETIKEDNLPQFVDAFEAVLNTNLLDDAKDEILSIAFKKLGLEVEKAQLEQIEWTNGEIEVIGDVVLAAYEVLKATNLDTLAKLKSVNVKDYLTVNYHTNEILVAVSGLLDVVVDSQLVETVIFPASEKYLSNEKLAGLADLHNIYDNYKEVKHDVLRLIEVIEAVVDLDLCSFLNEGSDIPYENTAAVESIITNVFALNYLNNRDRLSEIISKFVKLDLSNINFDEIKLVDDAKQIVAAYNDLLPILTDDEFFLKNMDDLNPIKIIVSYWAEDVYTAAIKDALTNLLDTTIVKESNGAVLLLALPLVKKFAPDYYEVVDPASLTIEQLSEDFNSLTDIVKDALETDLKAILKGVVFSDDVEEFVINTIKTIADLNLFADKLDDIVSLTADKLDGKRVGSYYFDKSEYNLTDVQYRADVDTLTEILSVVFDILAVEEITTIEQAKEFYSDKANFKELLKDSEQVANLEKLANIVTDLTIVKYNVLPVYNEAFEAVVAKVLGADLADLNSVYNSSEEMTVEVKKLIEIASKLVDFGLVDILNGANINYDQTSLVKEILNAVAELEYVNVNKENLLAFADSKVSLDLSQLDISSMNVANDFAVLGEVYEQLIPVLLSENNPFVNVESIKKATIYKSDLFALIYDYQSVYPSVVQLASEISIAPQLVKFGVNTASAKLSGLAKELVAALDVENLSDAEIIEDLAVIANMLTQVETLDVLANVLYREDILVTDNATISALVANAFELNVVDNSFVELLQVVLENVLKLDLSNVNLAAMDVEAEQALLVKAVNNVVVSINLLGVDNLSEVKPYVTETLQAVKADINNASQLVKNGRYIEAINSALPTLLEEAMKLTDTQVLEVVDLVSESQIVAKVALPLYEQKVYGKLTGVAAQLGDLSAYDEVLFAEDLRLLAEIVHNIYDGKLYDANTILNVSIDEVVPYLENIVRNVCMLNVIEVKKADLVVVAKDVLDQTNLTSFIRQLDPEFDLTVADADAISFKADADIYAAMAKPVLVAYRGLVDAKFDAPFLGNTEAVSALVEIYTLSTDTSLVKVVAEKALNVLANICSQFGCPLNENDEEVLNNVADLFGALIEVGLFSNNGIDLANTNAMTAIRESVFNTVSLPAELDQLVAQVCDILAVYGVIPFNWNAVSIAHEIQIVNDLVAAVTAFIENHPASIATLDLGVLVNPAAQAEITNIINILCDSQIVEQIVLPIVEGTFKLFTKDYTDGVMVYDATLDDVLANTLPNLWKVVDAAYEITGFSAANINANNILSNLDAVYEVVEVLFTDILLKDNVAKILTTVIGAFTNYDLTQDEIAKLEAIDYSQELPYFNAFFAELQVTYENNNFALDATILENKEVVLGLANAIEQILPSELFKALARKALNIVNNNFASKLLPEASSLAATRLADPSFTDELIIEDLYRLVEVFRNAANSGILENTTNFGAWNFAAVKAIVEICFDTNLAAGLEKEFSEACIVKVPGINEFYDSSMVIADWKVELLTIIDAIESLVNDGVTDLNNLSVDNLSGQTIEYISNSVILSTVLLDTINEKLVELDMDEYYVATQEKLDMVTDWDAELAAIKDLNELLDSLNNGSYVLSDVIAKYDNIKANTVLVNDVLTSAAEYVVPMMPVVKDYYDSSIVIADWSAELDAIINAVEALDAKGLNSFDNPLADGSAIDGEIMLALTGSTILVNAIAKELNAGLVDAGLENYTVTVEDVKAIDTVAGWDAELEALRGLVDLNENINSQELDQVVDTYHVVRSAALCNKILSASAETLVPELPIVKDYYDSSMVITDWNAELDAIVNVFDVLNNSNIDTLDAPIESLSGAIIVEVLESQILAAAFIDEFNNNLNDLGLGSYYTVTEAEIALVDSEAKWDAELATIIELQTLVEKINAGTVTLVELQTAKDNTETTVIAKSIFEAVLAAEGIII